MAAFTRIWMALLIAGPWVQVLSGVADLNMASRLSPGQPSPYNEGVSSNFTDSPTIDLQESSTMTNETDPVRYKRLWQGLNQLLGKEKVTSAPGPTEPHYNDMLAWYDSPVDDEEAMVVPDDQGTPNQTRISKDANALENTSWAEASHDQNEKNLSEDNTTGLADPGYVHSVITRLWWLRLGLIGAGLLCNFFSVLVLSHKDLRGVSVNILTQALAVADLVLLFSLLASTSYGGAAEGAVRALSLMCGPLVFFLRVGITWTMLMVTAVSADRFIAVCLPLHRARLCKSNWAMRITAGLLVLSVVDAVLQTLLVANKVKGVGSSLILGCEPSNIGFRYHQIYGVVHSLLVYVVPWLVVCSLNTCIIVRLRSQRRQWKNISTAKCLGEFRVNVSLVVICISFAVLCLPDVVFMVLHSHTLIQTPSRPVANSTSLTLVSIQLALREAGDLGYVLQTLLYPLALLGVGTKYKQVIVSMVCRARHSATGGKRGHSSSSSNDRTSSSAKWAPASGTQSTAQSPAEVVSGEDAAITFTF